MIRLALISLMLLTTPAFADTRTEARFVVKLYGATLALVQMSAVERDRDYAVSGEISTRGIVGALADVRYLGEVSGRRSGATYRPGSYSETVIEGEARKTGGLAFRAGLPHPVGYKAEERGEDALAIEGQGDTVDPLTGLFLVLADRPRGEVCRLTQHVFDGERRTVVDLRDATTGGDTIICRGTFRRIAGYPHDAKSGRRKVLNLEVHYVPAGEVMQVEEVRLMTDYSPARLVRR